MVHPFSWASPASRCYLLILFAVATAVLAVGLRSQGKSLETKAAPNGILSYEFGWNKVGAAAVLDSWKSMEVLAVARKQLKWDYAFVAVYPLLFSLACGMLADARGNVQIDTGLILSWVVLVAGLLDAGENYALLTMLRFEASEGMAKAASWCAVTKFIILYAAFGYLVIEGILKPLFQKLGVGMPS